MNIAFIVKRSGLYISVLFRMQTCSGTLYPSDLNQRIKFAFFLVTEEFLMDSVI